MTGRLAYALTEHQYEELRTYEHGRPSWRPATPNTNLIRRGCLDRTDVGTFRITEYGRAQLVGFRKRHGIPEPTPRTDPDLAYEQFVAMKPGEWYRFLADPANIAGLTDPERQGFERAAAEHVRRERARV